MIGLTQQHRYYLREAPTDMRKGFDGLSGLVDTEWGKDPTDGSVYLFINRRRDRMKMLVWESGGFMLYYKRLEQGTFDLPKRANNAPAIRVNWEVLVFMLSGIKLEGIVRKKRYQKG